MNRTVAYACVRVCVLLLNPHQVSMNWRQCAYFEFWIRKIVELCFRNGNNFFQINESDTTKDHFFNLISTKIKRAEKMHFLFKLKMFIFFWTFFGIFSQMRDLNLFRNFDFIQAEWKTSFRIKILDDYLNEHGLGYVPPFVPRIFFI